MRPLAQAGLWLLVFLLSLIWLFPYEAAYRRALAEVEAATGASLQWDRLEAGLLGVEIENLTLHMPSGARLQGDVARLRPTWGGLRLDLSQTRQGGNATLVLQGQELTLSAADLNVDTGSPEIGQARLSTQRFRYSLASREGGGELRMVVAALKSLPVPGSSLEVGARVALKPLDPGIQVTATVALSGQDLTGEGNVQLRPAPAGGPPLLNGEIGLESSLGRGSLRLSGTWARPVVEFVPGGRR